jgi:hypothetical protein
MIDKLMMGQIVGLSRSFQPLESSAHLRDAGKSHQFTPSVEVPTLRDANSSPK